LCALGLVAFAFAAPAHAQLNPRECVAQGTLSFSPGLRTAATAQITVSGSGQLTDCVDAGGATGITGVYTISGSGSANCATQDFTLTQTIQWNNGNTSVVTLQAAAGAAAIGAYTGVVTSGELADIQVIFATVPTNLPAFLLACVSPGGAASVNLVGSETFLVL
jgi:hypothetical protein